MLRTDHGLLALAFGALALGFALLVSARLRGFLVAIVGDYFRAEQGPFNLAVLRIVFFGTLILMLPRPGELSDFAALPSDLMDPPAIVEIVADSLPLSPGLATAAWVASVVLCAMAALGIYTRFAIIALLPCVAYVLTIPQLFGKVDHYHHVLWFAAILAFSRCADTLSVDAVRRGWREGVVEPISRSRAYALPLRLIWLLVGLIYFFPGLYKLWFDKLEWFAPETLRNIMWAKWYELDWIPALRIDEVPLLLSLAAAATIVFELGFVFAVFSNRLRPFLPFFAIAFHNGLGLILRIPFWPLQAVQFSLIDWEAVSRRLVRRPLEFVYDAECGICRRTVGAMRALAIPGGVAWRPAQEHPGPRESLLSELHVFDGDVAFTGFEAYRRLARRLPPLWPIVPLLYVPGVPAVGQRVYERVSFSRLCEPAAERRSTPQPSPRPEAPLRALKLTGGVLVASVILAGVWGEVRAWPVATYPTFAGKREDTRTTILYEASTREGTTERGRLVDLTGLPTGRAAGLENSIIGAPDPAARQARIEALVELAPDSYTEISVFRAVVSLDPARDGAVLTKQPETGAAPVR